jgi:hypothetical protein
MVPRQRTITEYQERRYMETVPREVLATEYYAIEHIKNYVPQVTAEAIVETTPVERIIQRTEYIPYERYHFHLFRTIVHPPQPTAQVTTVVD